MQKRLDELKKCYPVVLSQALVWRDMDAYQHINNAVYFRYFEDARIAYFLKANVLGIKESTGQGPILASTKCDFRAPLTYPDKIHIATFIDDIQSRRFSMRYLVYSEALGKLAAEGEGLIVFYDYQQKKSCDIPAEILHAITELQSGMEPPGT